MRPYAATNGGGIRVQSLTSREQFRSAVGTVGPYTPGAVTLGTLGPVDTPAGAVVSRHVTD